MQSCHAKHSEILITPARRQICRGRSETAPESAHCIMRLAHAPAQQAAMHRLLFSCSAGICGICRAMGGRGQHCDYDSLCNYRSTKEGRRPGEADHVFECAAEHRPRAAPVYHFIKHHVRSDFWRRKLLGKTRIRLAQRNPSAPRSTLGTGLIYSSRIQNRAAGTAGRRADAVQQTSQHQLTRGRRRRK